MYTTHCKSRMLSTYRQWGKNCPDCGETRAEFSANLEHIAVEHNKFINFLPIKVVSQLKDLKVFGASKEAKTKIQSCDDQKNEKPSKSNQSKIRITNYFSTSVLIKEECTKRHQFNSIPEVIDINDCSL